MKLLTAFLLGAALLFPFAIAPSDADADKARHVWYLRSNPATDCTGYLDPGERCTFNIKLEGLTAPGQTKSANAGIIRSITLLTAQQLSLDVAFYTRDCYSGTSKQGCFPSNMDSDSWLDYFPFESGTDTTLFQSSANAGQGDQYRGAVSDLNIYYRDMDAAQDKDNNRQLHVEIVNRESSTMKLSGDSGKVAVIIGFEPFLD